MSQVNFLERFGFNPYAEAIRLNRLTPSGRVAELNQQVESRRNHVTTDKAVSILYRYWLSEDGDIYTSPSKKDIYNVKSQIDFNERSGLFYKGILSVSQKALAEPNTLFALYSPAGKILFDNTPTDGFSEEYLHRLKKPYDLGQLYFMYFDGKCLKNVAVSIDGDNNPWLAEISNDMNTKLINIIGDEERKITEFLLHPFKCGNIDDFFRKTFKFNGQVFRNVSGEVFDVNSVMNEMLRTFSEEKPQEVVLDGQTIEILQTDNVTPEMIIRAYLSSDAAYMKLKGIQQISYGGGCGGTSASYTEISDLIKPVELDKPVQEVMSSFASGFRQTRQHAEDKYGSLSYTCGVCNEVHVRKFGKLDPYCKSTDPQFKGRLQPKC